MKALNRIICFFIALTLFTAHAHAQSDPSISAKSCILIEELTGYVLYEKNPDVRMPMASTTKLFTALMIRECCDLDEVITVSHTSASTEGSSAYLKAGERLTVEQLLYALLLSSGNDAAEALAEYATEGGRAGFIEYMNRRAVELGLINTHFTNPSGLPDDNHYTTARELAQIGRLAKQDPIISRMASSENITFTTVDSITHSYTNHNSLLRMYTHATGLKTGYTKSAGRCLVSSANKDGIGLICVTLSAPNDWTDHINLFEYGFSRITLTTLAAPHDITVPVSLGGGAVSEVLAGNASSIFLPQTAPEFSYTTIFIPDQLILAPITKGQTLGKLYVIYQDVAIAEYDMISLADVAATPQTHKNILSEMKRILNFLLL